MKYLLPALLLVPVFAFLSIGKGRDSKPAIPAETIIGCGPSPEGGPIAGNNGKFIPALPGLGRHFYTISTGQDSAQFYFNQGLNFYYSYHLRESLASFKEAARFDSSSAMVYWGQALSMGPYYNSYAYKMKNTVPAALAAMNRHRDHATAKENALVGAMQQRYSGDTTNADRAELDKAYANAMAVVVKAFPGDNDIKALYIDAVMLEHKWSFWNSDFSPKPWTPEVVALCEAILQEDPHHPAALHYYIHLTEASAQPSLALASADRLKEDMPGVGHMVHMATHMYQRNGLFEKGVIVNELSTTASNTEDSLAPMLGLGKNNIIHVFAVQSYCAMNAGMYDRGLPVYQRTRDKLVQLKPAFEQDAYLQYLYMIPEIAFVRFGKWDEILRAPSPDPRWSYARLLDRFARGMAHVRHHDLSAAKADLSGMEEDMKDSLLAVRLMPFDKPVDAGRVAVGILGGEILFAEGKGDAALASFSGAVAAEDSLIYREPPQWLLPARQYLGMYLLKMKRADGGEKVYREDLDRNPGNGWSLLGLYQSLTAEKRVSEAEGVKKRYLKAFEAGDADPGGSVF